MMGRIILLALAVLLLAGGGIMIVYPDKYISDVDRKTMSGATGTEKGGTAGTGNGDGSSGRRRCCCIFLYVQVRSKADKNIRLIQPGAEI